MDSFGTEERVGNKHIIIFYKSEEPMEDRLRRLESRLHNLEIAHGNLQNAHASLESRANESDQHLLCGEIGYFIDKLAANAVYGWEAASSRPVSVGYLMSPWSHLTSEEESRLDAFWERWRPHYTPQAIKRLTGLLQSARFPYAHLLDRAKLLDKETYRTFIGNCFKNHNAAELQQLLDFVADEFSSSETPLVERY